MPDLTISVTTEQKDRVEVAIRARYDDAVTPLVNLVKTFLMGELRTLVTSHEENNAITSARDTLTPF
uniref:Uncharacterized protein n=1 Tax=viral metagenome TaxID=1070528 RepID=A0A6M3LWI0_9ZZZZ